MVRPQSFRERLEEFERASLSTWAVTATETKGRDRHEEPDPLRTAFQIDVHRLLSSRGFEALAGKSAWLPTASAPNLLLVTLEAVRLAGSLARALRLNADLTQAIALGHALGAPPFADAGVAALADFGYEPREQALRVVERLEWDGAGLNLTWETRDGILTVTGPRQPATVEGQVVRLAVVLAQLTRSPGVAGAARDPRIRMRLGAHPREWGDALIARAATASVDSPKIRLGDEGEALLGALRDAVEQARGPSAAAAAERHRAVHCLQSLAIYALEHGSTAADEGARSRMIDELVLRSERDVVAAYRARFEPGA